MIVYLSGKEYVAIRIDAPGMNSNIAGWIFRHKSTDAAAHDGSKETK